MAVYMTQFAYTAEAWTALAKNPVDRSAAIGALVEKMGGRMLGFYYAFGEYDGVTIIEAPDEASIMAVLIAAISPGHIKATKTTPLITVDQALEAMRKAGALSYSAPKA
jgi:uncharacterized protein with GYD domain